MPGQMISKRSLLTAAAGIVAAVTLSGPVGSASFEVARQQTLEMADVTTHEIRSGNVVLGISEKGGGYINKLYIPGIGDVVAGPAARYGRGGQVSIRDEIHGRKYNPTQAGFTDYAGTYNEIEQPSAHELYIPPRPTALWNGDKKYDFTEWEDLAEDPYRGDSGHQDSDGIDERTLRGKQATEITSEFDFTGSYKDIRDGKNVVIPAFQFLYEFRFVREPGHCIRQFGKSSPIYDITAEIDDRSNLAPPGRHPSSADALTGLILSSTLRGDKTVWNPEVFFFVDENGRLSSTDPRNAGQKASFRQQFIGNFQLTQELPVIILATSSDPDKGPALGFYHSYGETNRFNIIGRSLNDNSILYKDNRTTKGELSGNFSRAAGMWLFGVKTSSLGLLSRKETPSGVYEAIRGEVYILIGTPNEIYRTAQVIQAGLPSR